ERLERPRLLVACVADSGEEERLQNPGARPVEQVCARDEHSVVRRWPRRQVPGTREELGRPVLHRADHRTVVVAVDGAPRAPVRLGPLDPALLVDPAPTLRLPPHAAVADAGRLLERDAREAGDSRAHEPDSRTSSVASGRAKKRNGTNVVPSP